MTRKEYFDIFLFSLLLNLLFTGKLEASDAGVVAFSTLDKEEISTHQQSTLKSLDNSTPKITGVKEVCTGGKKAILTASVNEPNAKFQWYQNGSPIAGATSNTYTHISHLKNAGEYQYHYTVAIGDNNSGFIETRSDLHTINDISCCIDAQGNESSQKLIWKNDFGTFESERDFYVWDYSDITEPKKIYYTTKTRDYRYCLSQIGITAPEGAIKCGQNSAVSSGGHEVAAYISANYGAKLGWAAMCGNGRKYGQNSPTSYFADHTHKIDKTGKFGACLFVNAYGGDFSNDPLLVYKQEIKNLCSQTHLTVKCYVNTYSDSENPVRIKIIVYDSENPTLYRAESEMIEKYSVGGSPNWIEVSVTLDQIVSSNLTFEIHDYAQNIGDRGDDLMLDDIHVYACSTPNVELYFDPSHSKQSGISCDGSDLNLYVDETSLLKSYYNVDRSYLYQYNTSNPKDPDFKRKWQNLTPEAIPESSFENQLSELITSIKSTVEGKEYPGLYFRVVAGNSDIINNHIVSTNYFNPNDPCADFSISDPIHLQIDCPTCTRPANIKIISSGGKSTAKQNTIYLCEGETLSLQTEGSIANNDKYGNLHTDYTISWFNGNSEILSESPVTTAPNLTVNYEKIAESGNTYTVLVHDNFENAEGTTECDQSASIIIQKKPKPEVPQIIIPAFCVNEASLSNNVKTAIKQMATELKNYTYTITNENGNYTNTEDFLSSLDQLDGVGSSHTYSIVVTNNETGCSSDTTTFSTTPNSKPEIISLDSLDVHSRAIITENTKGTHPFSYWIDDESAISSSPIFTDLKFTKHIAFVRDDNGCETQFPFSIAPPRLFIPEFFTPNNDGINDTWVIGNLSENYSDAKIHIYDRHGKHIYSMTGEENCWDGSYNGQNAPSTDYWYVIDLEEIDTQYTGHFTLIRR